MDWRDRLISPCIRIDPESQEVIPEIPSLLVRLLLFDTFVLQTCRFQEFPPLVRRLGARTVLKLLDSGALKLQLDPNQLCQVGQSGPPLRDKAPLPLGSYSFSVVLVSHYHDYLIRCIQDVHRNLRGWVSQADLIKIEEAIFRALLPRREGAEPPKVPALNDLLKELRADSRIVRRSLLMKLQRDKGFEITEEDLRFRIHTLDHSDFAADANLNVFGLTEQEAHKTVESAIFAVGTLGMRLEESRDYDAISGAVDADLSLFAEKFDLLSETLSCSYREMKSAVPAREREKALAKILQIRRLPAFELSPPDRSFNVDRFLEVRASDDAVQFRAAVRRLQSASHEELTERVNSFRIRLGSFAQSATGKTLRVALSSLSGLLDLAFPFAGTAAGLTLSSIDSFLLERVLPADGMTLFLSSKYRSLFETPLQRSPRDR